MNGRLGDFKDYNESIESIEYVNKRQEKRQMRIACRIEGLVEGVSGIIHGESGHLILVVVSLAPAHFSLTTNPTARAKTKTPCWRAICLHPIPLLV